MAKADFIHDIKQFRGMDFLLITDMDLGNTSVTNDIVQVVKDIEIMENIDTSQYLIIYRDSQSIWDGYDSKTQTFIPLQEPKWFDAASRYIQLLAENKIPH